MLRATQPNLVYWYSQNEFLRVVIFKNQHSVVLSPRLCFAPAERHAATLPCTFWFGRATRAAPLLLEVAVYRSLWDALRARESAAQTYFMRHRNISPFRNKYKQCLRKLWENKLETNWEIWGANNREKVCEEFPDTFWGNTFFDFFKSWNMTFSNSIKSWKNHFFQISEKVKGFSDPGNRPNLG